ncbi:MAG: DUF4270 family protein [Bacteroidota bacterium]
MKQLRVKSLYFNSKIFIRLSFLWGVAALVLCTSCVDTLTGDTGVEVLPPQELVEQEFIDTLSLELVSVQVDTGVPSCNQPLQLFGNMYDPFMGETKAITYSQVLRPDSLWDASRPEDLELDSIILELDIFDFYGQFKSPQRLEVFEITDSLPDCVGIDSRKVLEVDTTLNLTATFRNPTDGFLLDFSQDTVLPGTFIVPLDASLGEKLLSATEADFESEENFQDFFGGLSFSSSLITPNNPMDPGGIFRLDLSTSSSNFIRIHYRGRVTPGGPLEARSTRLRIGRLTSASPTNFFNVVRRNVPGTPLADEGLDNNEFVQAGNLVVIEGKLPGFGNLDLLGVNQAELIFPVDTSAFRTDSAGSIVYEVPNALEIVMKDGDTGEIIDIPSILGQGVTVSSFNEERGEFTFIVSPFLQAAVDKNVRNLAFTIRPITQNNAFFLDFYNFSIDRVILGGINNPSLTPRIFLTVTRSP